MMKTWTILLLAAFVALICSGCPGKKGNTMAKKDALYERVKAYNEQFYWRDFDKASQYVVPEKKYDFLSWSEPMKRGFTLESYSITQVELSPSGERAAVVVERSYIMAPAVTLQRQEFSQEWVLKDGEWYLSGPPY